MTLSLPLEDGCHRESFELSDRPIEHRTFAIFRTPRYAQTGGAIAKRHIGLRGTAVRRPTND